MDVHLSSPAPVSVPSGYHKILKPVKDRNDPTILGSVGGQRTVEKMMSKLGGESRRVWFITMYHCAKATHVLQRPTPTGLGGKMSVQGLARYSTISSFQGRPLD